MPFRPWTILAFAPLALANTPPTLAHTLAQSMAGASLSLEASSDERRRSISWSNGNPVLSAELAATVADAVTVRAGATSLWGRNRHGDADAVVDLGAAYEHRLGGWTLSIQGDYHLFPGASGQGYGEIGANAAFLLGPASLDLFARYAPDQDNIGGDNLYIGTSAAIAIPATPFTLSGHVGRSSGGTDDPARAARLRPDGRYWDHGVALDWYRGRWNAGLRYANSSIDDDGSPARRNTGARLIAHIGLSL